MSFVNPTPTSEGYSYSTATFQTAIQCALAKFAQDEARAVIDKVTTRVLPPRDAIVLVPK